MTFAGGDANSIYVSIERNDNGAAANISRPAVLRYDLTAGGNTLVASQEWDLTVDLPGLGKNGGLEAITWIPDDVLVAKGLLDESTGATYNPANYADHGRGLFFVGVEQTGQIMAYALNHKTSGFTRVATITSGFPRIMELTYEPDTAMLWAVCDNDCNGRTATLDVKGGRFAVTEVYERPAGMADSGAGPAVAPAGEAPALVLQPRHGAAGQAGAQVHEGGPAARDDHARRARGPDHHRDGQAPHRRQDHAQGRRRRQAHPDPGPQARRPPRRARDADGEGARRRRRRYTKRITAKVR